MELWDLKDDFADLVALQRLVQPLFWCLWLALLAHLLLSQPRALLASVALTAACIGGGVAVMTWGRELAWSLRMAPALGAPIVMVALALLAVSRQRSR